MIQKNLLKTLFGMVALVLGMALLGYLYEEELISVTTWVVDQIGFPGLMVILMVTDTLVTPFPPDILLLVISKSPLSHDWPIYVGILGVVSVVAGLTGYSIGRWLGHYHWAQRLFGGFKDDHRDFIQRYGFWAIVLGAVTPLPYSITCWAAGMLGIRWTTVLAASVLFRIPRFYLYYWLLSMAGTLFLVG